ncbi:MAG TPA: tetratricopeptide repeat protein [Clostridiales bacterium]|nr:tetratricopeptide repeat protein [Clostridiales bacterium]
MNKIMVIFILIPLFFVSAQNKYKFPYKINFIDHAAELTEGTDKADAFINLAGYHIDHYNDIKTGLKFLLRARDISIELNYSKGLIRSYEILGDIYFVSGNYSEALDYYVKKADILRNEDRPEELASNYLKMSDVCLSSKNFDRSHEYASEAARIADAAGNEHILSRAYYFMAIAVRGKFDYPKALEYTYKSLELSEKTDNNYFAGNCYNAIGDLNEMMGNFKTAFENYKKAEKIYEEHSVHSGLSIVYFNLASMHKVFGDYSKALEYLNKSLEISVETRNEVMIRENYMGLYGLYNLLKDFKNANNYYMLLNSFTAQSDSLNAPISKIEIDYEISKNEMDKELLNLKLEQERNKKYIFGAVFFVIFSVTYFFFYRKLKQKKINELRLEERRVRAELSSLQFNINPHFLFNSISSISELINLDPTSARKMLQNISGLLRYTLRTSKNEFVKLEEEILMIRKYLEIEKIRFGKRLEYQIDIPDTLSNMLIPPLLIQPLVENSIKHGLSNKLEGGMINISAYENIPGRVTITVEDDGESKEGSEKPEGNGIGLSSVKERLRLVYNSDHNFKVEKNNGFKVIISIPKKI